MEILNNYGIESQNFMGRRPKLKATQELVHQATNNPMELSDSARKLIKRAHLMIEEAWTKIRKKQTNMTSPIFKKELMSSEIVELSPIYNGYYRNVVLKVGNQKGYKRIIVDHLSKDFRYEDVVNTPHGSITRVLHDSRTSAKNVEIAKQVNEIIEKYLPKVMKNY